VGLALTPLLAGCVYFNALYNAREAFERGERARLEGRAEEAADAYADAVRKAARGYRREPEGKWADDALYVLGRAYLRQGDLPRARRALDEAVRVADDEAVRQGASLYLGAVLLLTGERSRALALLNQSLAGLPPGALSAEGHIWRARLLLAEGMVDQGWWDLDRGAEQDPRLRVAAYLERLAWGVLTDEPGRALEGATALLASSAGASQADSLEAVVREAARRWGHGPAAELLAPGRAGRWPPGPRDRVQLLRVRLLIESGDTLAAETEAGWVAGGVGEEAVQARLLLARIRMRRAREVAELAEARRVLLPAAGDPRVSRLAEDMRTVELLDQWGSRGRAVAWFAAAELARDGLGAPSLARALLLRYATEADDRAWVGKALLAALATTPDPRSDPAVLARLEGMARDPYVRAAGSGYVEASILDTLETRLREQLDGVLESARAEARRRDVGLRGDTLPPSEEI
jgi:tetratricopeptide (TPR) repeat protein